jgi:LuxR family maltose regulon positive regulatory protein
VLVSTPAGFGKTTLLSSWYATHQDSSASEREPVLAWLTLEPADNDPARFWMYVLHTLQRAHGRRPDHPVLDLDVSPLASTETFLTALLNAFSVPRGTPAPTTPRGTILILDEYHLIANEEIHTAMAFLLEHLPASLHLLIASRTYPPLPLTKLRAGGYLAELDAEAISFSAKETAEFLQRTLPLAFTSDDIARLQAQTGGWIMPLHLAALAWQGRQDTSAFIASLRGDHHAIVEYLASEVFGQQPPEVQRFLLATSLLAECTGALCDAVLERTNSQSLLQQLEREHLFLFPAEETHRWYRYHPLFVDFLQDRLRQLDAEMVAGWHGRAADWYLQQEPSEPDAPRRALPHLLAMEAWERAACLIEAASQRMLWQTGEVITLRQWILELPQEVLAGHPRLALASTWAMTLTGQFDAAESALDTLERSLRDGKWEAAGSDDEVYRQVSGETLAIRARIASFHDVERAGVLSKLALERLPEQSDVIKADLLLNLGYAHLRSHDFADATCTFQNAQHVGRRSGNVRAYMLSSRYLAGAYETRGLLSEAATVYRQALRLPPSSEPTPPLAAGAVYIGNAMLLYERNEVVASLDQARRGLALGRRSGEMKTLFPGYVALAQIHQGLGDDTHAWEALEEAERLADLRLFSWTEAGVAAARVRLHLAEGRVDLAARVLSKDEWQVAAKPAVPFGMCPPEIQLAWARVLLAKHSPDAASVLLQWVLEQYRLERPQTSRLPVVTLYSLALAAAGASEQSLTLLADAVPSAIVQGYIRTFVDEGAPLAALLRRLLRSGRVPGVESLLAAFPTTRLETSSPSGVSFQTEPVLSAREVEVMRLLAVGKSNQQIADELVIALSTVRTHTKHIYRKLGVQGRVRSVARATALHLL